MRPGSSGIPVALARPSQAGPAIPTSPRSDAMIRYILLRKMIIGLSATLAASGLPVTMLAPAARGAAKPASAGGLQPLTVFNPIRVAFVPSLCIQPATRDQFASIIVASCNGSDDQAWEFIRDGGNNHYYFVNQHTGFCMDAFDGADTGGRILANECAFLRNGETLSNDEW